MLDFSRHSLKNYTNEDVERWQDEGMRQVAAEKGVDFERLKAFIAEQEVEIAELKKYPTIEDNSYQRQCLRQQVVEDYLNLFSYVQRQRKATIVLGQIASGKSSYCTKLASDGNSAVVDVDFVKQGHGQMQGLRVDFDEGRGTDRIHEEAKLIARRYLSIISEQGCNLVIPKTGSTGFASIEKIAAGLKANGYEVTLAYIDLPIKNCVKRNIYRFVDEYQKGLPCRLIPLRTIKMIDDKPFNIFAKFMQDESPLIDNYIAFSNDVKFGEPMQKIDTNDILEYVESIRGGE